MAAPPPSAAPILLRTLVRSARELAAAALRFVASLGGDAEALAGDASAAVAAAGDREPEKGALTLDLPALCVDDGPRESCALELRLDSEILLRLGVLGLLLGQAPLGVWGESCERARRARRRGGVDTGGSRADAGDGVAAGGGLHGSVGLVHESRRW